MNEDHQTQTDLRRIDNLDDEIELIDILRVIWKWKYLILSGTIVCGLVTAIISLNMRKIYSIDMTLMPGILSIEKGGKTTYLDSPDKIKALIDSGAFNNDILNYLNKTKEGRGPKKLNFKVTIPKGSITVYVKYETANAKQGMVILDHLSKLLIQESAKLVQNSEKEYDIQSNLFKHQIDLIKADIQSYKRNMANIERRISELITEIKLIKNNTASLVAEKNKLRSKKPKENDSLRILFYTYLIQENVKLSNNFLNEINDYKLKIEEQLRNIHGLNTEKETNLYDIKKIQFQKDNIQNIQILQAPTKNPLPIKPKTKFNIILSLVAGLFLMLFLAFFLEYLRKYRKDR
ncbi:MAG: hypothetical protein OQK77_05520 [Psychromonas sp.]|nr:hypothetical protein [Psychromonas sp.]